MPHPSDRLLLRPLGQGLAVAGMLAGMALMAFAAGLVLLGAMIVLPLASGLMAARRLRGGAGPAVTEASTLVPRLTPP